MVLNKLDMFSDRKRVQHGLQHPARLRSEKDVDAGQGQGAYPLSTSTSWTGSASKRAAVFQNPSASFHDHWKEGAVPIRGACEQGSTS